MKRMILSLVALVMMLGTASAQRLVSVKNYGANWQKTMISLKNKPNGTIYRLRKENQNEYLPRVPEAKGLEQFISERIDIGWLAMYRLPMSDDDYKFIVKIYDKDEKPLYTIDLGQVSGNNYCEVQDVRWDNDTHNLLFNMACPSYASGVNGKGSKLHCYNPERQEMVWSTDWLTSNDIFILDSKFVFCSYGFTSEKKFLFMLDKFTGKVYSKLPFTYKVEYLELQTEQNGREYLYAVDYNDHLYKYYVDGAKTVADLQALSQDDIIALNDEVGQFFRFPERDGVVIPEDPYSRFDGFNAGIDMLIGSTNDEALYWIDAMGGEEDFDVAVSLWRRYITMSLDSVQRRHANRYLDDEEIQNTSFHSETVDFLNDLMFRGPAIEMAQRHAAAGGKTYLYCWAAGLGIPMYGACHGCEVCYVLNTGRQIKNGEAPDPALASKVQQMWVNFATTGNPSIPAYYWPAYETTRRPVMFIAADTIQVVNDLHGRQRQLIAPLMKEYISPIFSDLLDKAPWYAGVAIGTLVAVVLLLVWLIVKLRRRIRKGNNKKQ